MRGSGRHLRTESALTGRTLLTFHYNEGQQLDSITDANANVLTIARDTAANTFTTTGPTGVAATGTLDGDHWLQQLDAGEWGTSHFNYGSGGQLSSMQDARAEWHRYSYQSDGRFDHDTWATSATADLPGGRVVSLHGGEIVRSGDAIIRTITTRDGTSLSEGLDTVHTMTLHESGLDERTHAPPIGPSNSTRTWTESRRPRSWMMPIEQISWSEASGATGASWSRSGSWSISGTSTPLDHESRVDMRWGENAASALWVASTTRRQVTPDSVSAMSNATEVIDTTQLVAPVASEAPGTDDLMTSPLSVGGVAQVWTSRMWRPSTSVGWTVRETSPMGRASVSQLDLDGRVTDTTPPVITQDGATLTLHPTHVEYGSHGRVATVTRGARVVSYGYYGDSEPPSRRGRVHTVTVGTTTPSDPTSMVTFSYDEGGVARSSRVAAPSGAAVDTVVDEHGNVTSITPPGRSAHVFAYGLRDRLSAYQPPPASGTSVTPWQTTYDTHVQGMTRLVSRPDGDFDYGYDHGRLQSVTLPAIAGGSRPSVTYGYDDALGVLRTVTHTQNGVVEYGYNKATRGTLPLSETWRVTADGVLTSRSVSWTHDSFARIASWTVEGGPSLAVSYDGDGLLASVGALTIEHDATAGTEQGTTLTSGGGTVATTQRYNAYGEVVSRGSTYGSGGTGLSFAYEYDTFGRVRHITESGEGAGEERWYGYDADGRLATVCATATCSDGGVSTEREHYAYDANGNRTSWSNGVGSFAVPLSGGVDAQDRLLRFDLSGGGSVAYTYDNTGRTATRVRRDASDAITESTTLVYDSDGALRSFTRTGADAVSVTYDQDAVGRRIARRVGGSVTARWLYRGIHPVAEYDGAWVLQRVFVYGTRGHVPDYVLASEGGTWVPYRVVTDHLGSVRRVVRVSDGAVVQRMSYDAYGRVLVDEVVSGWSALPFGYAGGIYDRETGLVRFGARDYDAEIGRWTAKDPIGFNGRDMNLYGYVQGAPVRAADTNGKGPELLCLTPGGAAVCIAIGEAVMDVIGAAALAAGIDWLVDSNSDAVPSPETSSCPRSARASSSDASDLDDAWFSSGATGLRQRAQRDGGIGDVPSDQTPRPPPPPPPRCADLCWGPFPQCAICCASLCPTLNQVSCRQTACGQAGGIHYR